ncbi:hypothetical protein HDV64DRAFT_247758 [Trichoderma sp. TUCIM 5745]
MPSWLLDISHFLLHFLLLSHIVFLPPHADNGWRSKMLPAFSVPPYSKRSLPASSASAPAYLANQPMAAIEHVLLWKQQLMFSNSVTSGSSSLVP